MTISFIHCLMMFLSSPRNGLSFAVRAGLGELKYGRFEKKRIEIKHKELIVIPSVFSKCIRGNITHIDHCSKFFFMPLSEREMINSISSRLNDFELTKFEDPDAISKNMMVAVRFGGEYKRGRILTVNTENPIRGMFFKVSLEFGEVLTGSSKFLLVN